MNNRHFHLKLKATYQGEKNAIDNLQVHVLKGDQWENLELNIRSPGFQLYINGLFSCQHLYMRTNAAERNLMLGSSAGEMLVNTNKVWEIQTLQVSFIAKLRSGNPSEADINYIRERMHHCPVSSNLPKRADLQNMIKFI
jgi:hypothetical protein